MGGPSGRTHAEPGAGQLFRLSLAFRAAPAGEGALMNPRDTIQAAIAPVSDPRRCYDPPVA